MLGELFHMQEVIERQDAEIAKLKAALKAAQAVFNELHCYSTGVSVMAEEDMVELFGKYSDLADGLLGGDSE